MAKLRLYVVFCDVRRCKAQVTDPENNSLYLVRKKALNEGWKTILRKDYCPEHKENRR